MSRVRAALAAGLAAIPALSLAGCSRGGGDEAAIAPQAAAPTAVVRMQQGTYFSADSPWNTRIDAEPTDPDSATLIAQAAERTGVRERAGDLPPLVERRVVRAGLWINTEAWTTPIVTDGVPTTMTCRQSSCGDDLPSRLPVPADVSPDPRYDGWMTILDPGGRYAYDLWRARRVGAAQISYQFARRWDLDGLGFGAPQVVGARGSGLPLFAGLIRRDELLAGRIDHALAISVPGPAAGTFVPPASTTDGNGRVTSLPEGARIRLREGVVLRPARDPRTGRALPLTAEQRRRADAVVASLRMYGAIVVDRASVPTLYAEKGALSDELVGNELQGLTLDDFEVVQLPGRQRYPADPSGPSSSPAPPSTGAATAPAAATPGSLS